MKQRNIYRTIALMACCLLLGAACSTDKDNSMTITSETMSLYSSQDLKSGETSRQQAVFLFWDFGDWLNHTEHPVPLHIKKPDSDLNDYNRPNPPYNTGELYPDGNLRVVATGYAPATLEPERRNDNTENYERLTLPYDSLCITDVLTSINPLVASASLPFDREDGEALCFEHAQARVYFKAKLADDMGKFVQKVRIQLGASAVATHAVWNRETYRYDVKASDTTYTLTQPGDDQLSQETSVDIGWAYIVPELVDVPVTITVEKSEDVSFTNAQEITFPATLNFNIDRNSEDPDDIDVSGNLKEKTKLYANESYTFTLVFSEEGIELVGNLCPWEEGGYLIVPVYPLRPDKFGQP